MATTKRTAMLFFAFAVLMVSGAAIAWSCTVIVSDTETSSPDSSADSSETVSASSEVVHSKEANSNCDNNDSQSAGCGYSLGIVNPDKVDSSTGSGGESDTCHYETEQSYAADPSTSTGPQFDTIDDSPSHNNTGSETELDGSGDVGFLDDDGDSMGSGETKMCFYSSSSDGNADHLNNAEDGAATATEPTTIVINN